MIIRVELGENSYDIVLEHGVIKEAEKYLFLDRKVLIVTDEGVPKQYADIIFSKCLYPVIVRVKQGEGSKSIETFKSLLERMLSEGFTRSDCVVALGGGVVGDLAGFAAACYMRGIDFYNIPTTVLSQVDSSIGGKTAVNLNGIKNVVGAFYQPKKVLIDTELLNSLPQRQRSNGLAEALKMALTSDEELFDIFENGDIDKSIDTIIEKSILIKKSVVEQDEKEAGLRIILNFGHTIGHGIESFEHLNGLYHGECVALGMLPMCEAETRERLKKVMKKLALPTQCDFSSEKVFEAIMHDKKFSDDKFTVITVDKPGKCEIKTESVCEMKERLNAFCEREKTK